MSSTPRKQLLTRLGVLASAVLFSLKMWAALVTGSIAVLSDALNSFLDVFSYSAVHISALVQENAPDENHQFGHRRAEPLAGLIIAVLAAILGTNILKEAIVGLFSPRSGSIVPLALGVLGFSATVKVGLAWAYKSAARVTNSAALKASFIDSRNDVLASGVALLGATTGGLYDALAALAIGTWIMVSGVRIGLENMGYLMGVAPSGKVLEKLRHDALKVTGVVGVDEVRAHYVGDKLHAEVIVAVPGRFDLAQAHDVGVLVRESLEQNPDVNRAFVHINPEGTKEG